MGKKESGNVTYRELIKKAREFADFFIDNVRCQNEEGGYEYDTAFFMDNQEDLKKVTDKVKELLTKFRQWDNKSDEIMHHVSVLESISKDLDECLLDYKRWMMAGTEVEQPQIQPEQKEEASSDDYDHEESKEQGPVVDRIAEALANMSKKTTPGREWYLDCDGESWLFAAQNIAEVNGYIGKVMASLDREPKNVRLFRVRYEEVQLKESRTYRMEV
jgi:hypothetical protein